MKSIKTRRPNSSWDKASHVQSIRFEVSVDEWLVFPYVSLKQIKWKRSSNEESIQIDFAAENLSIAGNHLCDLFTALQSQEVEAIRLTPGSKRGHFSDQSLPLVRSIRLLESENSGSK